MLGSSSAIADIVPVDICVNMMIAIAWHVGVKKSVTIVEHRKENFRRFAFFQAEIHSRLSLFDGTFRHVDLGQSGRIRSRQPLESGIGKRHFLSAFAIHREQVKSLDRSVSSRSHFLRSRRVDFVTIRSAFSKKFSQRISSIVTCV